MVIHTPRNIVYIRVLQSAIVYLPPSTKPALTLTNSYTTSFVFKIFQHIANKSPIEQLLTKIQILLRVDRGKRIRLIGNSNRDKQRNFHNNPTNIVDSLFPLPKQRQRSKISRRSTKIFRSDRERNNQTCLKPFPARWKVVNRDDDNKTKLFSPETLSSSVINELVAGFDGYQIYIPAVRNDGVTARIVQIGWYLLVRRLPDNRFPARFSTRFLNTVGQLDPRRMKNKGRGGEGGDKEGSVEGTVLINAGKSPRPLSSTLRE